METCNSAVVIVVPIYKSVPNQWEKASMLQLSKVLSGSDVVFVAPMELDCKQYTETVPSATVERFASDYFMSINGYNRLMLSQELYSRFVNYKYMLVHQLDAFVFRDELMKWCSKGYDYIGAPWFEGWGRARELSRFIGVGNGGFSLRRIDTMLRVLSSCVSMQHYRSIYYVERVKRQNGAHAALAAVLSYVMQKNPHSLFVNYGIAEDKFWGLVVPRLFRTYKVAPYNEAVQFAFETRPSMLYKEKGFSLPFGCHAWMKYEPEFWHKHIEFGNQARQSNHCGTGQ